MSLDDQLNPNDGSLIDRIDSSLFEMNKKTAKLWQDKTYRSKRQLETLLYYGSAIGFLANCVITPNIVMGAGVVLGTLRGFCESHRPKSAKEEEMECELRMLPRKTMKYLEVAVYGAGVMTTASGIAHLVAGAITGEDGYYTKAIHELTYGLGFISFISADYVSKSNMGNPPPRPKKKPLFDRIKEKWGALFPEPIPEPARAYAPIVKYG